MKLKNKVSLIHGDAKDILSQLPDESVHCCVTSPPYWQLRDYSVDGQLGRESTPEEYIAKLVSYFSEVKRVLRRDGTFWLNIGDTYKRSDMKIPYRNKNLLGIPWKLALALQDDGWNLRCDVIWQKSNVLPDGVKDRPTRCHEYLFLFTKKVFGYFYDYWATLEDSKNITKGLQRFGARVQKGTMRHDQDRLFEHYGKRNKRSVWTMPVSSFKGAHFATFPPDLIEPCILAGTSAKGCCSGCGSPYERILNKERSKELVRYDIELCDGIQASQSDKYEEEIFRLKHVGWEPTCSCGISEIDNCVVLDPFSGTGTTGEVSLKHRRDYIGIEINKEYLNISNQRLGFGDEDDLFRDEFVEIKNDINNNT